MLLPLNVVITVVDIQYRQARRLLAIPNFEQNHFTLHETLCVRVSLNEKSCY